MGQQVNKYTLNDPSVILNKLIKNQINGSDDNQYKHLYWYQAVVLDVDESGGRLEKDCPPRTLLVKVISPIKFQMSKIVYPISDFELKPISKGEPVLMVFGSEAMEYGFWFSRLPTGNTEEVKSEDFYKENTEEIPNSINAFGDAPPLPSGRVTREGLTGEPKGEDQPAPEGPSSNDHRLIGRKDELVLASDGSFLIGKNATEKAVLGDRLETYLNDPNNGKLVMTQEALKAMLPVIAIVVAIVNALNAMAPNPELMALAKELNYYMPILTKNVPVIGEKGNWKSENVKVKE